MLTLFQITLLAFQSVWIHQITGESDVAFMDLEVTYCEAHRECFKWGQSKGRIGYMIGENYKKIFQYCNCSQPLWVNIHSLLHPSNCSHVRKWNYGEKVSKLDGFSVNAVKENNATMSYSTLFYTPEEKLMHVNTVNSTYAYVCQVGRFIGRESGIQQGLFRADKLGHDKLQAHFDQKVGCFTKTTEATTAGCALRCYQNPICRSFYYNNNLKSCLITAYVDSLLSSESWNLSPLNWRRFSRPGWSLVEV
ncbi:hypothetical protein FGIG_05197 [Fasciola gigantica]|uniref:Apple domain-containing protein n=1 Tax=Fasciola gigantica TaxID=46835 RepID=A0A504YME2_FASGI|nr:hypothetical protein FGIG_05197 [Fasciola gigantica]